MQIGIIGAGHIGGTLGRHWVRAGHAVVFGVRFPDAQGDLLAALGDKAAVGSPADASHAADAVVFAAPFGAWRDFAAANGAALAGKTVIDASNPYPERDGAMAAEVVAAGTGSAHYVAGLLPGAHVVKAFNTVSWVDLRDKAGATPRLAMPIAGSDAMALDRACRLAEDAGFEPVVVGGLGQGIALDPGSAVYARSFTADQVRDALGL